MPGFRHDRGLGTGAAAADPIALRSLGLRLPTGYEIATHTHDWHQLVYASDGVMSVHAARDTWVVPPHRAVWVPSGFAHSIKMTGAVRMRTVYVRSDLANRLPEQCCVVQVTPLLRELVLETVRRGMLREDGSEDARLARVLLDQIVRAEDLALQIRYPADKRARVVAAKVQLDLASPPPLAELARGSGASARTIERLFVQETGMTFGRWLQQVRALDALKHLAAGASVTHAGLAVGYDSTSAFIAMFRRVLGKTPGSYFDCGPRHDP